jgi:trans-aconitate methyltransferase
VAAAFLNWLSLPPHLAWIDFGCGTGALTQAILAHAEPRVVLGCDRSQPYLSHAKTTIIDPRCDFQLTDLPVLPTIAGGVDVVVAGLVLNFLPDPAAALLAFRQVLTPGGTIAAYVWDYAGGMQLLRTFWDAATALDPAASALDEGARFPLCQPAALQQLFRDAGLSSVAVTELTVPTPLASFEDYWQPFLGGQGPGGQYVASLAPQVRERLAERLRATLTTRADGTIPLTTRAWAVRGVAT